MPIVRPIDRWFIEEILPHERYLTATALRLTGQADDARDLVQDVFARMLTVEGWSAIANPRAFMVRTLRNLAVERLRRSRIVAFQQLVDADHLQVLDDSPDPQRIAEGREAMTHFRMALDQLPEKCRTVFVRRRIHDQSPRDIATELGVSLSTLEKRLARAIELLTQTLEPLQREIPAPNEAAGDAAAG